MVVSISFFERKLLRTALVQAKLYYDRNICRVYCLCIKNNMPSTIRYRRWSRRVVTTRAQLLNLSIRDGRDASRRDDVYVWIIVVVVVVLLVQNHDRILNRSKTYRICDHTTHIYFFVASIVYITSRLDHHNDSTLCDAARIGTIRILYYILLFILVSEKTSSNFVIPFWLSLLRF